MILTSLFNAGEPAESRASIENPSTGFGQIFDIIAGAPVKSGVHVNEYSALQYTAVSACVRVLAETVAHLPLNIYERTENGQEVARAHPLYELLHYQPNSEMTSFVFRETLQAHVSTWGNGYSYIERNVQGRPLALVPLLPNVTWCERKNGRQQFVTKINGKEYIMDPADVVHIPGLGFDGLMGYSPIHLAREAIGLGMAATEFGARFFGSGAALSGVLEHPGKLQDAQKLRENFSAVYNGISNTFKTAVLEEGMKYTSIGVPPEDAQFLETRKFQRTEIASMYRVPPHMIQDLERATFSNIEHQDIGFVKHTMVPWLVRWEQELSRKLLTADERRRYFIKFNVDGLLRGDQKSRYDSYHLAITDGWMNRNEARELENMNSAEGLDEYLTPLNMQAVGGEVDADDDTAGDESDARSMAVELTPIIESFAQRLLNSEQKAIEKLLRQSHTLAEFAPKLTEFNQGHQRFIENTLQPIAQAVGSAGLVARFIEAHQQTQLAAVANCSELNQVLEKIHQRNSEQVAEQVTALIGDDNGN